MSVSSIKKGLTELLNRYSVADPSDFLKMIELHPSFYVPSVWSEYYYPTRRKYKFKNDDDTWIYYITFESFALINVRLKQVYEVYSYKCYAKVIDQIRQGESI